MAAQDNNPIDIPIGMPTDDLEKDTVEANNLIKSLARSIVALGEKLKGAWSDIFPKKTDAPITPELTEEPKELELYSNELNNAEEAARALSLEMGRIAHASELGFRKYDQVLKFSESIQQAEQNLAAAKEQLKKLADEQITTVEYTQLQEELERARDRAWGLRDALDEMRGRGVSEQLDEWKAVASQLEIAEAKADALRQQAADMRNNGTAFINPEDTSQYQELEAAIERAQSQLETNKALINQETLEQARLNVVTAQEAVAAAQTTREREKAMQQLMAAQNQLAAVAQQNVTPAPDTRAMTAWDSFKEKIKGAGSTVVKAIGTDAKRAFSMLKNGLSKAIGWIKRLRSHASSTSASFNGLAKTLTSLKTLLVGRIKSAFISQIVNNTKEGIQALAQFDSRVDQSISNVKNRFKEAGSNLAVSFGTLINAVAPIITSMLNAISEAIMKLNAIIAALRGQTTMTVAKKQTESYAESLNGAAGSANKAAKAQKKYNNTLSSYDELHKLSDNSDNDTNAGAGAGANTFETVPVDSILKDVPQSVMDFVERIKEAVKAGDWYGVGGTIAEGLNVVVSAVDDFILRVQPKITAAAAALGEGVNGFVGKFNFEGLGITLGDGVNTVNSAIDSFITKVNWEQAGRNITKGVNGFVSRVSWSGVGTTIAGGFNGAIDFIYGAIDEADWDGYGEALSDAVDDFVDKTNWAKAGKTLEKGVTGLLDAVVSFLTKTNWVNVGEKLGELITNINWGHVVESIISAIINVKIAILELLYGFGKKIIMSIYNAIVEEAKSLGFDIEGENIIMGILHGIGAALVGIFEWVKDHIFKPIVNAIKKAFGISSPAKEMEPMGDNIAGGLLEGILSGAKAIFDWIIALPGKIFDLLVGALDTVKNAGKKLVGAIKEGITSAWEGLKDMLSRFWNALGGFLGNMLGGIIDAGKSIVGAIKDGVSKTWDGFKDMLSRFWNAIGGFLGNMLDGLEGAGRALVGAIKDGAEKAWSGLKSFVGSAWDTLKGVFTNPGDKMENALEKAVNAAINGSKDGAIATAKAAGTEIGNGLVAGIESSKDNIANAAGAVSMWTVDAVKRRLGIASPSKVFMEIGGYIDEGLAEGITKSGKTAVTASLGVANAVTDAMNSNLNADAIISGISADLNTELTATLQADALTNGLDVIAEKLGVIADRFAGISIAMPEPALGTVIPPRTRISDYTMSQAEAESGNADLNRKLDRLIELLTAQQGKDSTINVTVPVKLDQRQIGDAVARYTLSGQRMTNGGLR